MQSHNISTLDYPVRASLFGPQAHLAVGQELARRYAMDINEFASTVDDTPPSLQALADLVEIKERVIIFQVPSICVPDELTATYVSTGVQMVATRRLEQEPTITEDVVTLGAADAAEMVALAQLTQPGPFMARTYTMGHFRGIRQEGKLVAMAGERMRFDGYTEVSGVCTHPDARGLGLARKLSTIVAASIQARGDTPILHAWADNHAAITLYQSLGFRLRAEVNVSLLKRIASTRR